MSHFVIVYDCDDVLIGLNKVAHELAGISLEKRKYYSISKEPDISQEQKDKLIKCYGQVDTFRKAEFYDGADEIFNIEESGLAKVYIHSLSYTEDILAYKREKLKAKYPNISEGRLLLECGHTKSSLDDLDILIEDNIENIAKSKARLGNILIKKPYNRPENYDLNISDLRLIEVDNLRDANNMVKLLLNGTIILR